MHCNFSLCDHARRNPALHADPSPPSRWGERRPLPVGEPPPPAAQELLLKLALCWVSWKPPLASQLLLSLSPRPGGGRKALVSTDFPHCQRPSAEAPAGARVGRNISFKGQADVSGKPFPEERAHVWGGGHTLPAILPTPYLVLEGPSSPGSRAPTVSALALITGRLFQKKKKKKSPHCFPVTSYASE